MTALRVDINGATIDVVEQDIVATYSLSDIGDISSRTGDYTNVWDALLTARNKAILENADIILNNSTKPYERLNCIIYIDGVEAVNGFAEIISVSETFKLRLYSGNSDFFSLIKDKKLQELDYEDFNHERTLGNIHAYRNNIDEFTYPIIDYFIDDSNTYVPTSTRTLDVRELYPALFVKGIIERIVSEVGYTLNGELVGNSTQSQNTYWNLIIPFANDRFVYSQSFIDNNTTVVEDNKLLPIIYPSGVIVIALDEIIQDDGNHFNTGTFRYTATKTFSYRVKLNQVKEASANFKIKFSIRKNGSIVWSRNLFGDAEIELLSDILLISSGDYLDFTYESFGVHSDIDIYQTRIEIIVVDSQIFGGWCELNMALPDMTQGDFLKAILQKFCAFIDVDNKNKVCNIIQFNEIVDNFVNADDWSDKVDSANKPTKEFKLNKLSKVNNFKYLEDDTVPLPDGTNYEMIIENENLPDETDMVVSKFAPSETVTRLIGLETTAIRKIDNGNAWRQNTKPRILVVNRVDIQDEDGDIDYTDGSSTISTSTNIPLCYFISNSKTFNLGWGNSLFQESYDKYFLMVNRLKYLKENIRLNIADINKLDFTKPVWLSQHNAYFIKKRVNQFSLTQNTSTEVELIKINR